MGGGGSNPGGVDWSIVQGGAQWGTVDSAGYVGAYCASGNANRRTAADNLLIDDAVIGDGAFRHRSFAQFFRAGPLLLGTVGQ